MKVRVNETIEVTEDQRREIAEMLDGKASRRRATRDESRDFIWRHGRDWPLLLQRAQEFTEETGLHQVPDLIGDVIPPEYDDLI